MDMSKVIRDYIEENGIIKNVIAKKSGIQEKKFYRMISGLQKMYLEDFESICIKGLDRDPSYFFKLKLSKNEIKQSA